VLWTLRYGDEVRDPHNYFGKIVGEKTDPKLMTLVKTLIDERTKRWEPNGQRRGPGSRPRHHRFEEEGQGRQDGKGRTRNAEQRHLHHGRATQEHKF